MTTAATVTLRRATTADSALFFRLRNDAAAVATSTEGRGVTLTEHATWFHAALLTNAPRRLWAIEADGWPVGYLRAEETAIAWVVSIALTPTARGQGIGATALRQAAKAYPATTWRAWIRRDNVASQRAFERAGYGRVCQAPGLWCYERAGVSA